MPRCGCASDICSCYVVAGPNTTVTGSGTQDNPYVIAAATTVVNPDGTGGTPAATDMHFTGQMIDYAGDAPPSADYTLCDGKALSRTAYALLFSRIGTTYGAGNGSTTFNVPNLTDRSTVGTSGSKPRGTTGGAATATLTSNMLPPHSHTMNHTHADTAAAGIHDHAANRSADTGGSNVNFPRGSSTIASTSPTGIADSGEHSHSIPAYTGSTGNGSGTSAAVPTQSPYLAVPKYIRIQGGP